MKIGQAGIDLVKEFEGCQLMSYTDSVGVWTIGYGCTTDVAPGMHITLAQAEQRLIDDLKAAESCVNNLVRVPLTQGEFDALVAWTFNLGCGTFRKSRVLEFLNASNYDEAVEHMKLYNKAGGKVLPGLERRREAEAKLFESSNV